MRILCMNYIFLEWELVFSKEISNICRWRYSRKLPDFLSNYAQFIHKNEHASKKAIFLRVYSVSVGYGKIMLDMWNHTLTIQNLLIKTIQPRYGIFLWDYWSRAGKSAFMHRTVGNRMFQFHYDHRRRSLTWGVLLPFVYVRAHKLFILFILTPPISAS